jgi:hypothetical protein
VSVPTLGVVLRRKGVARARGKGTTRWPRAVPDKPMVQGGFFGERTGQGEAGSLGGRMPNVRPPGARRGVGVPERVGYGQEEEDNSKGTRWFDQERCWEVSGVMARSEGLVLETSHAIGMHGNMSAGKS